MRAVYLRVVVGTPSQILKYGAYPMPKQSKKLPAAGEDGVGLITTSHKACTHYPCQQLYSMPFDEAKFRAALVGVAAEDGIEEDEVDVKFVEEKPNDWTSSDSYDVTSALVNSYPKGTSYMRDLFVPPFGEAAGWKHKIVARVYNNDPGKPTVLIFGGSAEGWDGSSNFNFMKEVMRRYTGLPPVTVFAKPMVSPASASKFDEGFSFPLFLAKMPINVFKNIAGAVWNNVRSAKWAGGHGAFVPRVVAMNFTDDESAKLAAGAKKLGSSPFACFTYAAVKACKEVLGRTPTNVCNQASLQTRHYPVKGQGTDRDFVCDWLIGAITPAGPDYDLMDRRRSSTRR